jgi:dihydrofolate reductase
MSRKVVVYIACSLDGYIAQPNDDLSFLSIVQRENEDYGYADFMQTIDTVILGRKTYDWVIKQVDTFPHADKPTYVLTSSSRKDIGNTKFYNEDLEQLISALKSTSGKNIFVDGGAQVVNSLLQNKLVDELILSIIPICVGAGTRLFNDGRPEQRFRLAKSQAFESGLVQLHYVAIER